MGPHSPTELTPEAAEASLAVRWNDVHRVGREIGAMAALSEEAMSGDLARFPDDIEAIGGARLALAQETLCDIDAMLQPGLCALRAIAARGQDTTAPALALWREFHAARSALLALAVAPSQTEAPLPA